MKTFTVKTKYGTYKKCYFVKGNYMTDDSLALEIWNDKEGPIADITVCLGDGKENFSYLDLNNCPWAARLVEELGIAKDTKKIGKSGYCFYPLYEFDMDKVNEYVDESMGEL